MMKTELFDFELPQEAIALRPVSPRDKSRLLEVSQDGLGDHHVSDLPQRLRRGDVLVFNETRVLPAALKAVRPVRPHGGGGDVNLDINLLSDEGAGEWKAFVRPAKRVKAGDILGFSSELSAKIADKGEGGEVRLAFNFQDGALKQAIEACGQPPLPPYIARKRKTDARDVTDYQTIYARQSGSVAAPTAGLHFTENLLEALKARGVQMEYLTLHVGAGTFLPVKSDDIANHHMHSEFYSIEAQTAARISQAKSEGRRIIAVGTTSLRALESACNDGVLTSLSGDTDIFITPGYEFKIVDGLMTNFHLPRSTLFMLVCALGGVERMKRAYNYAINSGYRFYSYGDSSLLWHIKEEQA